MLWHVAFLYSGLSSHSSSLGKTGPHVSMALPIWKAPRTLGNLLLSQHDTLRILIGGGPPSGFNLLACLEPLISPRICSRNIKWQKEREDKEERDTHAEALGQRETKQDEAERETPSQGDKRRDKRGGKEHERMQKGKEARARAAPLSSITSLGSFPSSKRFQVKVPIDAHVFLTLTHLCLIKRETEKGSGLERSRDSAF